MVKRISIAMTFVFVAIAVSFSFAQSSPSDFQNATFAFDFRINMMRNGEFMKMMDVEKDLEAWKESSNMPSEIDMSKVDRIFGAMSLPDDVATIQSMSGDAPEVLPFDLFIRMHCEDAENAKAVFAHMEEISGKVEIDGKTYLLPPEEQGLTNMLMHMADDNTIELGTKSYITQEKRIELFSEGLAAAWKLVPNHALRLALDIKGENALLSEAVEMGKATTEDATARAYMDLIDNAENIRLSIDFDSPNLIVVAATGVDDEQAEDLRSGLDAVMGMAKLGGKQALSMVPDPDAGKVLGEILDSLKATADGQEVQIAVAKPAGFNEAVKKMVDQLKQMQEMMQQGPPEGFGDPVDESEDESEDDSDDGSDNDSDGSDESDESDESDDDGRS